MCIGPVQSSLRRNSAQASMSALSSAGCSGGLGGIFAPAVGTAAAMQQCGHLRATDCGGPPPAPHPASGADGSPAPAATQAPLGGMQVYPPEADTKAQAMPSRELASALAAARQGAIDAGVRNPPTQHMHSGGLVAAAAPVCTPPRRRRCVLPKGSMCRIRTAGKSNHMHKTKQH